MFREPKELGSLEYKVLQGMMENRLKGQGGVLNFIPSVLMKNWWVIYGINDIVT